MTEFEVVEIINGVTSNILANQALFITILSAYLVVAYSVGQKLTSYQVAFINGTFIIFSLLGIQAVAGQLGFIITYSAQLLELRGVADSVGSIQVETARWGVISVRFLLSLGALVFMWQVRHAKTE